VEPNRDGSGVVKCGLDVLPAPGISGRSSRHARRRRRSPPRVARACRSRRPSIDEKLAHEGFLTSSY